MELIPDFPPVTIRIESNWHAQPPRRSHLRGRRITRTIACGLFLASAAPEATAQSHPATRHEDSMRKATAWTLQALVCAAALACAPAEPDSVATSADTTPPPAGPPYNDRTLPLDSAWSPATGSPRTEPRPERKRVAIRIEGTDDTIAVRLVPSPADFEPAFSTYVPDDMSAQVLSDSAGLSMRFAAVFGGVPNDRAYLQIFVYAEGNTLLTAREYVHGFVRGRNPEADPTRMTERFAWSDEAYTFRYQDVSGWIQGTIALGRYRDRFFHVLIQYPPEFGDGMAPRTALILDEFRWTDSSTPLAT